MFDYIQSGEKTIAYVKETEGSNMTIEFRRSSACGGNCKACKGSCESINQEMKLINDNNYKVGDVLEISLNARLMIKITVVVYLIPLLSFLLGLLTTYFILKKINFNNYEIYSIIVGVVLLLLSLILVRRYDRKIKDKANSIYIINKVE